MTQVHNYPHLTELHNPPKTLGYTAQGEVIQMHKSPETRVYGDNWTIGAINDGGKVRLKLTKNKHILVASSTTTIGLTYCSCQRCLT